MFKINKQINLAKSRYLNWWLNSYPPLHGITRFFVYFGLLLSAIFQSNKSPIRGIWYYEATDPELYRTYGLIDLLNIPYINPEYLKIFIVVLIIAWFSAAIGLFFRFTSIVTALGVFFLHGMFLGSNAFNHGWFLSMYAFIALCFTRPSDRWSIDYYLFKRQNQYPRAKLDLLDTGFARQLFLVIAVCFYFVAGYSKLYNTGLAWANGHLIQYFAECYNVFPLGTLLANSLWLSLIAAMTALCFELGGIAAFFSHKARSVIVIAWLAMHVGIKYSLGPQYFQNMICLALLIDWQATITLVKKWLRASKKKLLSPQFSLPLIRPNQSVKNSQKYSPVSGATMGAAGGTAIAILMTVITFKQIFWWPFTTVYMYSSNYSLVTDMRANYPRLDYYDPAKAQQIASEFQTSKPNIEATQYLAGRLCLRLTRDNSQPLYLFDATEKYSVGVPKWKQFVLTVLRPVLIADFASKPQNQIQFNPNKEYPAQTFLTEYTSVLRRYVAPEIWQKYDHLELVYPVVATDNAYTDKETIPPEIWQHYRTEGDEIITIPEAKFMQIAAVSIK